MGNGRAYFQKEMQRIEEQALGGLDMVVGLLDEALEALDQCDAELAAIVVADDDRIDGRYLEVHQGVLSLLARQAPVAGAATGAVRAPRLTTADSPRSPATSLSREIESGAVVSLIGSGSMDSPSGFTTCSRICCAGGSPARS